MLCIRARWRIGGRERGRFGDAPVGRERKHLGDRSYFLTDGDAGLRGIQRRVAPEAEHVLDWFHVGMRFENLKQVAKGINGLTDGALRIRSGRD